MNDDRLDQLIRSSLEWQTEQDARHAPSLATSARRVAGRIGRQPASQATVVRARPGSSRSVQLLLAVLLLALMAAAAIYVGSRMQEQRLPSGLSGSLGVARGAGHAAVSLPDGRVFVIGGWQAFRPVGSAELWDPITGTFGATGSPGQARNHASATLLQDGRVLVAGGFGGPYEYSSMAEASAELWDPKTKSFRSTGSLVTARAMHSAILLGDGKVLVTGDGPMESWDPATGEFGQIGIDLGGPGTLLADGRILIVGGVSAKVWDPGSAGASDTGSPLEARAKHTATLLPDGRVLLIGGRSYPGIGETGSIDDTGQFVVGQGGPPSRLSSAELWDPITGLFTETGSLTQGRIGHTATVLPDGRVLVLGGEGVVDVVGHRGSKNFPGPEVWDPITGTFASAPSLVQPRADHSAVLLTDGRLLVIGGHGPQDAGAFLRSVEIYDPLAPASPSLP